MKRRAIFAVAAAALAIPAVSFAVGQGPGGGLVITNVGVDFGTEQMYIYGENLDFGPGPLMVYGGGGRRKSVL